MDVDKYANGAKQSGTLAVNIYKNLSLQSRKIVRHHKYFRWHRSRKKLFWNLVLAMKETEYNQFEGKQYKALYINIIMPTLVC